MLNIWGSLSVIDGADKQRSLLRLTIEANEKGVNQVSNASVVHILLSISDTVGC
jgi:hypothetical protein